MEKSQESVCERCKGVNVVWFVNSELWNKYAKDHDIICPLCFIELAESQGYEPTAWELVPENES